MVARLGSISEANNLILVDPLGSVKEKLLQEVVYRHQAARLVESKPSSTPIDKTAKEPEAPDDEYTYWPN